MALENSRSRILTFVVWTAVAVLCVTGIATTLILPPLSKSVGLVYAGF